MKISTTRGLLEQQGWSRGPDPSLLPDGWLCRTYRLKEKDKERTFYLSPCMKKLSSINAVLDFDNMVKSL